MRSSDSIPPEIWLAIAQNLSGPQVNQLASLCRTFAALADETNKERMRALHLPIRFITNASRAISWNTVFETFDLLKTRKDMVHLPPVKKLIFSSFVYHGQLPRPQRTGALYQLSQLFRRPFVNSSAVKRLYKRYFPAVDSLQFTYKHLPAKPGAPFVRFAATTYAAFSSNLRELSISIESPQRLGFCLPAVGSISSLPRLETMRLSVGSVPSHRVESVGKARLRQLVLLYTTQTLRTLEIRFKSYPDSWRLPVGNFLPPVDSVGSLQTFSFWVPDYGDRRPTDRDPAELLTFIRRQLATLVQFAIHGFPSFDYAFERNPPAFRSDTALSFRIREDSNWVARTPATLRRSVLELEYFQDRGDRQPFTGLANLQVLRMHLSFVSLSVFVQLAGQIPRLASLRLEYSSNYGQHMIHCMDLDIKAASEDTKTTLRRWRLRDLAIVPKQVYLATVKQSQQLMSLAASVVPSVVTLNGHDVRDPPQTSAGAKWVWVRNKYLLSAAAERRRAAAK